MYHVQTVNKDEGRVKTEKDNVRVVLRNCGYPELALKESEQLGKRQMGREEEVDDSWQNIGANLVCLNFTIRDNRIYYYNIHVSRIHRCFILINSNFMYLVFISLMYFNQ